LNAHINLGLKIGDSAVGEHRYSTRTAVEQLGELDGDVDERAFDVLAVVILQRLVQVARDTNVVYHVAALLFSAGSIDAGDGLEEIVRDQLAVEIEHLLDGSVEACQ
jgi:hypothetical protein